MTVSLSRNRDYRLLWISQALSGAGFSASMITFPLLVLAVTGSPAMTGLVLGVAALAQVVVGVPGGALVDRWNRKKMMLAAEAAQALAVASLVFALWLDVAAVPHMVVVAAVMGVCNALFGPAEDAALARIVPHGQLSTAVAMNSARGSLGALSGTALGGFLFAAGRLVPFAFNVCTHTLSVVALLFVRVPHTHVERQPARQLGKEMVEGLRWVWQQRHVRVTVLCAVSLNFFFSAYYIVIIVLATERGVSSGEIGIMVAMLGVGGILGALLAPYLHRRVSPYVSIIGVFWALTALTPLAVLIDNGFLMGGLFFAMALLPPTANTTISTYQLLLTPDGLRGRLTGVMGMVSGVSASAGPVVGGLLVQQVAGTDAVLLIAAAIAVITVLVTCSPTMRTFPRDVSIAMDASEPETTKGRQ
ncbi:MAG TPA: MFS transporter [Actinophytocola sp.]|uniref:MFS transporter n=1 Tax=Actinophytocola sp. TaxID=1872138 RepID=UPI002DB60C27|nr:MFS transporter [Actinophytocola sp.]HEU5476174.1 MFS transporter [Actinophytocola sp.]